VWSFSKNQKNFTLKNHQLGKHEKIKTLNYTQKSQCVIALKALIEKNLCHTADLQGQNKKKIVNGAKKSAKYA
jgi:hypothetical protein